MKREEKAKLNIQELFGDDAGIYEGDDEYTQILNSFQFVDVYERKQIDGIKKELLSVCILATKQCWEEFDAHIIAALKMHAEAVEIMEALFQCAPYAGLAIIRQGLKRAKRIFIENGIEVNLISQKLEDEERFEKGLQVQKQIFGESIDAMRKGAPDDQKHIQDYLSMMCFGDFYTRGYLDLKMRELITMCVIAALGGCEQQLRAHVRANISVGNQKETLMEAITVCMPYLGFPRTLNAISIIHEVLA